MKTLYLIEWYTKNKAGVGGWDIKFSWAMGRDEDDAVAKVRAFAGNRFDCVITIEEAYEPYPLTCTPCPNRVIQ